MHSVYMSPYVSTFLPSDQSKLCCRDICSNFFVGDTEKFLEKDM